MDHLEYKHNKVMIIDDAEVDRFLAKKVFCKNAFAEEVVSADSAKSALNYLNENQDIENALPDLIFLDINMPEMSGFDFLNEYVKLPENVKCKCIIIMLSSSLHPEDKDRALSSPFVRQFMNKPLTAEKLNDVENLDHSSPD